MQIESQASITVVKNNVLLCKTCLHSSKASHPEMVVCHLEPDTQEKHQSHFCGQGYWLLDGEVVDFKDGWAKIYKQKRED
jgi:hypothetical protein